jgi:heme exporter protein D
MEDILGEYSSMLDMFNMSFLIWSTVGIVVIIVLWMLLKSSLKKKAKRKEKEAFNKNMEELLAKYTDIIADKVVMKLNSKEEPVVEVLNEEKIEQGALEE